MLVNVCPDDIFWIAELLTTNLGMVMHHYEPDGFQKKLVGCLQGQGQSATNLVSNWILTFCQPNRVTPEQSNDVYVVSIVKSWRHFNQLSSRSSVPSCLFLFCFFCFSFHSKMAMEPQVQKSTQDIKIFLLKKTDYEWLGFSLKQKLGLKHIKHKCLFLKFASQRIHCMRDQ